jgi:uncharacterized protein YgbK (DUF1537 family)
VSIRVHSWFKRLIIPMPRRPLIVLADDLTGAAEVAALAFQAGRSAVVVTRPPSAGDDADVLVFDSDTRLAKPSAAARRIRTSTARLKKLPHAGFFKKTDSVLRGPVLAELAACAKSLGRKRALLVAGNPSMKRVIRDGRLFVDGRPIHQTAFARDPHHPAATATVLELLHAEKHAGVVSRKPGERLPRSGIIVGDHHSVGNAAEWTRAVTRETLPAGAADFFHAWLQTTKPSPSSGHQISAPPAFAGTALLLHGTTAAPATRRLLRFNGLRAPATVRVAAALRHRGGAAVAATSLTLNDPLAPPVIAMNFARLARELRDAGAFRHLLIAGGATAASVLRALGWRRLEVIRVWAPGVVSLRPSAAPDFTVTLKPGSYPWPAGIRRTHPAVFS